MDEVELLLHQVKMCPDDLTAARAAVDAVMDRNGGRFFAAVRAAVKGAELNGEDHLRLLTAISV